MDEGLEDTGVTVGDELKFTGMKIEEDSETAVEVMIKMKKKCTV